jgi:hypothetical protein
MDARRFDALTKAWTRLLRRQMLGGLATGALGPLLGLGGRDVSAQFQFPVCQRSSECFDTETCVHKTCTRTCEDPFRCSDSGSGTGCPTSCFCAKKPGGGGVCVPATGIDCPTVQGCRRQRNCPAGQICSAACCGQGEPRFICALPCVS